MNSTSISCCRVCSSSSQVQVNASRWGRSKIVYSPEPPYSVPSPGLRIMIRTRPPTRGSTSANGVSQFLAACHQRLRTSTLVQASKSSSGDALILRSMRNSASGRSGGLLTASPFHLPLLGDVGLDGVEHLRPAVALHLQPGGGLIERAQIEAEPMRPAIDYARDDPSLLEDLEVPRDRRLRDA